MQANKVCLHISRLSGAIIHTLIKLLEVNAYIYIFCGGKKSLEKKPQLLVGQKKRTSRRKSRMNTTLTDAEMILIRSVTTVTCSVYTTFCYTDLIFTCPMWTENIKPIKKIIICIVNNVTYWITYIRKCILTTFWFLLNYFWPNIDLNVIVVYYIDKKRERKYILFFVVNIIKFVTSG